MTLKIRKSIIGFRFFSDSSSQFNAISDNKADVERPLPMIYQSGYLTVKEYDADVREFKLDIPNNEVKQGFITLLANNYFKTEDTADSCIRLFVKALKRGDLEQFRQELTSFLASISPAEARTVEEWLAILNS